MSNQKDDGPQPQRRDGENRLDYARADPPRRMPICGIIAFAAMVLQIPWAYFAIYSMFWFSWARGLAPLPTAGAFAVISLPTFVALAFGVYSVKIAGIALRNIFGVIGLLTAAAAVIFVLIAWSFG